MMCMWGFCVGNGRVSVSLGFDEALQPTETEVERRYKGLWIYKKDTKYKAKETTTDIEDLL
jgi:hypothetical protein